MNILLYLIIILLGGYLGNRGHIPKTIHRHMDTIQWICLLFLLFVMGLSIGLDEEVIRSFDTIGIQGIIFALLSIIFSVLAVKLVSPLVLSKGGDDQ